MGQRHMFNTPEIFDADSDQGWNYTEQPYMPTRAGASESSSRIPPVENMVIQGGHFPSQWNHAPRSSGYPPPIHNGELPYSQPQAPGPYHDPFPHQSTAGNFHMPQDNYSHHPSSSNHGGQTIPRADASFYDQMAGSGRGSYKRKSPVRYFDVGSSSDPYLPADPWQEKLSAESYQPWEHPPRFRVNNLSIGSEGTSRNVRSRAAVDLDTNLGRDHMSSNPVRHPFPIQPNSGDFWGQSSNASSREWNQGLVPPAGQGVTFGSDSNIFSHDRYILNEQICRPSSSRDNGGYHNDVTSNKNPVPHNVNGILNQSVRGVRSGYGQRAVPTYRPSSSNFRPVHLPGSEEGQQMAAESHPSRHPRAFSTIRFRNLDRNGRALVSSDRYRPSSEEASFRERLTPEGLMVVDHSTYYGSRTLFDQHRDMRLDIDNMGYEELLALGERIGHVNTGLSDGSISKCLTESIYCSSDQFQEEATCVICLEEYKNMDDVGTLKGCSHDFHVGCIRKWLSMKNVCPICKATAMDEEK